MKFAVIVYPGSNCDTDLFWAMKKIVGQNVEYVHHDATSLAGYDGILIPGGFSYGDYLRSGAIARFSPISDEIIRFANEGKPVFGTCNGFQILTELGLLPGALQRNENVKFICKTVSLNIENPKSNFTSEYDVSLIDLPIAHGEGNYYCDNETLKKLKANKQIIFTYQDNVNGSVGQIAGIVNERGNVLGMMPHPERAVEELLGSKDGVKFFESIVKNFEKGGQN